MPPSGTCIKEPTKIAFETTPTRLQELGVGIVRDLDRKPHTNFAGIAKMVRRTSQTVIPVDAVAKTKRK